MSNKLVKILKSVRKYRRKKNASRPQRCKTVLSDIWITCKIQDIKSEEASLIRCRSDNKKVRDWLIHKSIFERLKRD